MSSELALTVKARAMFGKRLKEEDYEALIQKRDVSEIAAHLKNETSYSDVLSGINERAIHRQYLETLLRKEIFFRLQKLLRYSDEKDLEFVRSFSMKSEVQMILYCVRYTMEPDQNLRDEMIANMPLFSQKYFSFAIQHLAEVNTYDELLDFLKGTIYEPILRKHRISSKEDKELDFIALEHDLELLVFRKLFDSIGTYGNTEDTAKMKEILCSRAELVNLSIVYRLRKDFSTSEEDIRLLLLPYSCHFSKKEMEALAANGKPDDILKAIQQKYRHYTKDIVFTNIEHYIQQISFNLYHYFIEYETEPSLVLMSYMYLADTEISNLVNIIEGVRYRVSPDIIRRMLTY